MKHLALYVGAGLWLTACQVQSTKTKPADEIKTLPVTGVGQIEVMPDSFVVSGAVIKQNPDLTAAMNEVADVINKVQESLPKTPGLVRSEFNFATVNSNGVKDPECLLFNREAERTNSTLRRGEARVQRKICDDVTQQASITFTYTGGPVELAGNAISQLAEAGAVRVNLNGYKISNLEEIELQAGEKALKNARDKADRMASASGSKITGVLNLNSYEPTYNQGKANAPSVSTSGAGETESILKDDVEDKSVTTMNLKPGPLVISARVDLEYIYE